MESGRIRLACFCFLAMVGIALMYGGTLSADSGPRGLVDVEPICGELVTALAMRFRVQALMIGVCDQLEMIGSNTRLVLAPMMNMKIVSNWAKGKLPSNSMRTALPSFSGRDELAVAVLVSVARPDPAVAGFVDLRPEPLLHDPSLVSAVALRTAELVLGVMRVCRVPKRSPAHGARTNGQRPEARFDGGSVALEAAGAAAELLQVPSFHGPLAVSAKLDGLGRNGGQSGSMRLHQESLTFLLRGEDCAQQSSPIDSANSRSVPA